MKIRRIIFFLLSIFVITVLLFIVAFHSVFFFAHDEMRSEIAALSAAQITEQETKSFSDEAKTTKESHEINTESKQMRQTRETLPFPTGNE